jgi:hypothetical protein
MSAPVILHAARFVAAISLRPYVLRLEDPPHRDGTSPAAFRNPPVDRFGPIAASASTILDWAHWGLYSWPSPERLGINSSLAIEFDQKKR